MSAKDSSKPSCSHTHRFTDMWSKRHLHWSFMAPRRRHHLFQRLSPFKRSTSPRSGGSSPSHWAECRGREVEETPRPFRGTDHTVTGVVGGLRQLFPGIQRDGGKPPVHPHESGNTQMFSFFFRREVPPHVCEDQYPGCGGLLDLRDLGHQRQVCLLEKGRQKTHSEPLMLFPRNESQPERSPELYCTWTAPARKGIETAALHPGTQCAFV